MKMKNVNKNGRSSVPESPKNSCQQDISWMLCYMIWLNALHMLFSLNKIKVPYTKLINWSFGLALRTYRNKYVQSIPQFYVFPQWNFVSSFYFYIYLKCSFSVNVTLIIANELMNVCVSGVHVHKFS